MEDEFSLHIIRWKRVSFSGIIFCHGDHLIQRQWGRMQGACDPNFRHNACNYACARVASGECETLARLPDNSDSVGP
jgi:hypothetical protein